tara:strand:+ start:42 stop:320 length:279 start_codon:yes stop_codon:yes gene_type:complete
MTPQGWRKEEWENFKKNNPKNYMQLKEIKDRINAYVDETWTCWIDQERSMKKNGLQSMFEQILEDGKKIGMIQKIEMTYTDYLSEKGDNETN